MKTFLRILAALAVIGLVALALFVFWPLDRTAPERLALADGTMALPDVETDAYPRLAAVAADCGACHSADDGERYAGGRAFPTPMGTIYSTNITPDPETGIGTYTLADFRAALVDGIRDDGAHLYPAMPYTNYRKLTERDVEAIYAYFMNEVEPVRHIPPDNEMTFPFNLRFGIRAWKWLSLPEPGFVAPDDPVLARGAYLVEGPEHCGACHTPRSVFYVQQGYTAADPAFLSGGELNGWPAPSLRAADGAPARWSAAALKAYLQTGRNVSSATAGEMTNVIEHSLQYLPESDIDAIVAYLRAIAPNGGGSEDEPALTGSRAVALWDAAAAGGTTALLASADPAALDIGGRLYLDNCSACHMIDGKGGDLMFPELDGNSIVQADQPGGLLNVILHGETLPSTRLAPMQLDMPGFANRLNDAEIAALATFLRTAWSNTAPPVAPEDVADMRN
ncbi:Gluconate 2-dehydrogenase cytochrome c subunit precursor [Oceaniovalibus guishaninsula JLT2003]|uniref:Gluconate 2-dehydrogenase cytochrome c subunit n=1 Tax=Oceaniovalibus guishaninsula JLT2003 TaxID=1231392 RepID=K2HE84_9RHOB|nr:cytochrome c [Oceaniovalibus guishaninsula]EKE44847.1 Gluconate 2-dehydrogenase cytochrome c subunit precursor [Oceaniovalibus guishaninsula JLT2003]